MKVRILSGSQAGAVVEQEQGEAESNIATGFAEAFACSPSGASLPGTDGFVDFGPGLPVMFHSDQVIPLPKEEATVDEPETRRGRRK